MPNSALRACPTLYDRCVNDLGRCTGISPDISFPKANDSPASAPESWSNSQVTRAVGCDLRDPIVCVPPPSQLTAKVAPPSTMPEIAIAEDNHARLTDNDVRTTGQILSVFSISQAD